MGVVESAGDEFVGRQAAERHLSAEALARRRLLIGRVVFTAVVVSQLAWLVGLIVAARAFVFS
jgi:hypothetical protein